MTTTNQLPFTVIHLLHSNLVQLRTNGDSKYEITDFNKVPYIAKFNREVIDFLSVADEDGIIKFFKTNKKLTYIKEWLGGNLLASGGGDCSVTIHDVSTMQRVSLLRGHTESVKSIASVPNSVHILASGSRDGSALLYDLRCNRSQAVGCDVATVRAQHCLSKAHFTETSSHCNRSVLKAKINNSVHVTVKPSPIACLAFQNEFTLVTAGATDGFIKIWDLRKMWPSHSNPIPVYAFDQNESTPATKRGFSSLIFNPARSHAYVNCMNSLINEHNMVTYSPHHTRPINSQWPLPPSCRHPATLNTNTSTFIKSSLSPCGQFLLTGSSDSNAYIFATSVNRSVGVFRKSIPVIVLRGHESEVTTVDWNPFNFDQCVTCSDDNTIRLWTVKREIDDVEMGEFNFFKADLALEEDEPINDTSQNLSLNESLSVSRTESPIQYSYSSAIRVNQRIYGPNMAADRLGLTNHFDDLLFRVFECNGALGRYSRPNRIVDFSEIDLAERYESISLETFEPKEARSPLQIENPFFKFGPSDSLLSRLPINILPESETTPSQIVEREKPKIVSNSSVFSLLSQPKSIAVKARRKAVAKTDPAEMGTPLTVAKKRAQNEDDTAESGNRAKRRLLGHEDHPQTPKSSSSRTILHYFTPKSAKLN